MENPVADREVSQGVSFCYPLKRPKERKKSTKRNKEKNNNN
jgi:hypothetical protein